MLFLKKEKHYRPLSKLFICVKPMVLNISNHDDLHMYTRQEVTDICACFVGLLQAIKSVILSTFIIHTATVNDSITVTTCCKMLPVLPGQIEAYTVGVLLLIHKH